jgi:hypothetical protein
MRRYPVLGLRSKNELAKRISGKYLPYAKALALINDAVKNFDIYWYDSDQSEPGKEKYVRSAVGNSLGRLLELVDRKVLAPHDEMIPEFIFGGLSGRNHIQAAHHLLGEQRGRTLIKLDVRRFFEQVKEKRVFYFFFSKCGCSKEVSQLLSRLCCVPLGPKGSGAVEKSIARGFATSPRLALWCNLDLFIRLNWRSRRKLHGHDPELAIFVDDIGITASRIDKEHMEKFSETAEDLLKNFDRNQSLPINTTKKEVRTFVDGAEHLGLKLGRSKLTFGRKTRTKSDSVRNALARATSKDEKRDLIQKRRAYYVYRRQIVKVQADKIT